MQGMVAMADLEQGKYLTVKEAVAHMGCAESWVRTLLCRGALKGAKKFGERAWMIPLAAATEARDALTTRSTGKRHLAKRPLAKRKKPGKRKK
jgi:hypothetical protein